MSKFFPILGLALLLGGCLNIKTEHEIKPVYITVDVNLKVQKELDNFFGDIDAASATRNYSETTTESK